MILHRTLAWFGSTSDAKLSLWHRDKWAKLSGCEADSYSWSNIDSAEGRRGRKSAERRSNRAVGPNSIVISHAFASKKSVYTFGALVVWRAANQLLVLFLCKLVNTRSPFAFADALHSIRDRMSFEVNLR